MVDCDEKAMWIWDDLRKKAEEYANDFGSFYDYVSVYSRYF